MQLLLLVLVLKQSEAVSDQCKKLQEEIDQLEQDIAYTSQLKHNNEEEAGRCEVSGYYIFQVSLL